jgi:hypothetical protein
MKHRLILTRLKLSENESKPIRLLKNVIDKVFIIN